MCSVHLITPNDPQHSACRQVSNKGSLSSIQWTGSPLRKYFRPVGNKLSDGEFASHDLEKENKLTNGVWKVF